MTVKELITVLERVEDKDMPVVKNVGDAKWEAIYDVYIGSHISKASSVEDVVVLD